MSEPVHEDNVYHFKGLPLTPSAMREILKLIYAAGERFNRAEAIRRVIDFHASNGGGNSPANASSQMKKALQMMAGAGEVEKLPAYGYWQRLAVSEAESTLPDAVETTLTTTDDLDEAFSIVHESGSGAGVVYVYYFPAYRLDNDPFPIKVGMSTTAYQARIASQLGTSNPERPVIYRAHHTDSPVVLERYLHSALTLEGAWMDEAPGTEWYVTRPERIDALLEFVGVLNNLD